MPDEPLDPAATKGPDNPEQPPAGGAPPAAAPPEPQQPPASAEPSAPAGFEDAFKLVLETSPEAVLAAADAIRGMQAPPAGGAPPAPATQPPTAQADPEVADLIKRGNEGDAEALAEIGRRALRQATERTQGQERAAQVQADVSRALLVSYGITSGNLTESEYLFISTHVAAGKPLVEAAEAVREARRAGGDLGQQASPTNGNKPDSAAIAAMAARIVAQNSATRTPVLPGADGGELSPTPSPSDGKSSYDVIEEALTAQNAG